MCAARRLERAVYVGLVALCLAPAWLFKYFPSQDGPSHLYNASILAEWSEPTSEIFHHYYRLNRRPEPNWLSHAALAGLMRVGAPPHLAEKIFVSFFIVLFAFGIRYALGGVGDRARSLSVLALPFALGWPISMGFYNYCLGLAGFLWVFGWWYRRRGAMGAGRAGALAIMLVGLYFTHLVSVAGVMLAIFVVGARESWPNIRRLLPTALAAIPAIALGAAFMLTSASEGKISGGPLWSPLLRERIALFTLQNQLVCYASVEAIPAAILALGLIAATLLVLFDKSEERRAKSLLIAAGAFLLAYMAAPHEFAGGTYVFRRIGPLAVFVLIMWLGANWRARTSRALYVCGVLVTLSFAGMRTAQFAKLNRYLAEYVSIGDVITPPATVLPLCLSPRGTDEQGRHLSLEIWPFIHASGYLAAGRPIVDLSDYEGAMGYFPLQWLPGLNPYEEISSEIFDNPFVVDFSGYERRTRGRGRVDYVILWYDPKFPPPPAWTASIYRQLEAGYRLAAISNPRGCAWLYVRN